MKRKVKKKKKKKKQGFGRENRNKKSDKNNKMGNKEKKQTWNRWCWPLQNHLFPPCFDLVTSSFSVPFPSLLRIPFEKRSRTPSPGESRRMFTFWLVELYLRDSLKLCRFLTALAVFPPLMKFLPMNAHPCSENLWRLRNFVGRIKFFLHRNWEIWKSVNEKMKYWMIYWCFNSKAGLRRLEISLKCIHEENVNL